LANLSGDGKVRKTYPVGTGALDYFPDAIADVAHVSYVATQQHHPGEPMHWDRSKSTDHADCLMRHFLERGTTDGDGVRHSAKLAWRALALLQTEIENDVARQTIDVARNSGALVHGEIGPQQPSGHSGVSAQPHGMVCASSSNEKAT